MCPVQMMVYQRNHCCTSILELLGKEMMDVAAAQAATVLQVELVDCSVRSVAHNRHSLSQMHTQQRDSVHPHRHRRYPRQKMAVQRMRYCRGMQLVEILYAPKLRAG